MQDFRPKHPRLRELQLALVFGWRLPGDWDVTEQQWLDATAHEELPWEIFDGDFYERATDIRPKRQRAAIH
jgi:hypothetical protein